MQNFFSFGRIFSKICRQPVLGPGNSGRRYSRRVSFSGAAILSVFLVKSWCPALHSNHRAPHPCQILLPGPPATGSQQGRVRQHDGGGRGEAVQRSCWSNLLQMVKKKDRKWRPCGDFRRLNLVTTQDEYPLPNMADP
jgi:hypothetical protein